MRGDFDTIRECRQRQFPDCSDELPAGPRVGGRKEGKAQNPRNGIDGLRDSQKLWENDKRSEFDTIRGSRERQRQFPSL